MRILYMHQYFMTRSGIGGTRSYEFARRFAARGHEVSMVTAAAPGEPQRATVDGIEVIGVRAGFADYVRGTSIGYARRVLEFARFAVAATVTVLRAPRPDVIYATSPPLTMAIPAIAGSIRHRAPLVFEVRDLWPEAPIQMGALTNPLLQRLARWLERFVYRRATHVIALSPGMREGVIAAGTRPDKVSLISNASDLELFRPDREGGDFRERLELGDRFVCTYFGTMGEANDLTQVIDAAALMDDDVRFVLHGEGKRKQALKDLARERGLRNVVFSDALPKESVAELAAASDACMTIYKNVPILYTCSPNKLFDTFAAGRPAIVNTPGWLTQLVEEGEAGVAVKPADPEDLARQVAHLRDHPELVERYGRNARKLAETEFSRDMLAERALGVLERAARSH